MSAELNTVNSLTEKTVDECKAIVRSPFATSDQRVLAFIAACELSVAAGRLQGMVEVKDAFAHEAKA